jgi:hypothetical protein
MATIKLRITEEDEIELPIVHTFAPGLILAGSPEQGYEIAHLPSRLGIINGSPEFRGRLMDYGRAYAQLKIDWSADNPFAAATPENAAMTVHLKNAYVEGYEAPCIVHLDEPELAL